MNTAQIDFDLQGSEPVQIHWILLHGIGSKYYHCKASKGKAIITKLTSVVLYIAAGAQYYNIEYSTWFDRIAF